VTLAMMASVEAIFLSTFIFHPDTSKPDVVRCQ
jgi:hypothetical protein